MASHLVLALLPSGTSVDTVINNFTEQGFSTRNISVVMGDGTPAAGMGVGHGPLGNATRADLPGTLGSLGLDARTASTIAGAVASGASLFAMRVHDDDERKAAQESLSDYSAEHVQLLPEER